MTDKDDNNEDKKVIEDEEREKMLNEENKKDSKDANDLDTIVEDLKDKIKEIQTEKEGEVVKTGEVEKMKKQIEESQKETRGGIRVPIGGIKIPGFLRSRSRDKNKEGDATAEEGADLLEPTCVAEPAGKHDAKDAPQPKETLASRLQKIRIRNPFASKSTETPAEKLENQEEGGEGEKEGKEPTKRQSLIDSIKIPLVSVLPRTFTRGNKDKDKDVESGAAGLASTETLEGSKGSVAVAAAEDGMESVKLDDDEKTDSKDPEKAELAAGEKQQPCTWNWRDWRSLRDWRNWRERLRKMTKHEMAVAGVVLFLLLLIIIIAVAASGPKPPSSPPVINGKITTSSSCGPVEGLQEDDIFKFRGIPYAMPPVQSRRWRKAEALNQIDRCWNQTFKAHNSSSTCWQLHLNGSHDGSEDCLTLDIYTPFVRYDSPVPVVVLIDTATLSGGSPGALLPTPKLIKSKEVVFVRPNFRLGVLGFLAAEALSGSTHPPSSGNYGLSDIIAALRWVQLNIVHFGGDPKIVTLVGHRAGATLVTALASTNHAKGLFVRAWASSGSAIYPGTALQLTEQANQKYVDSVCRRGSDALQCLREADAEDLINKLEESWRPIAWDLPETKEINATRREWLVLDGEILKENLWGGEAAHSRLVIGTTAHSEASQELLDKIVKLPGTREEAVANHVRDSLFGKLGLAEEALRKYNSTWEGLAALVSDIRTVCPLMTFIRAQQNITFYVATMERNTTDLGEIADVDADMASLLGQYEPQTPPRQKFVSSIQKIFYDYVKTGELMTGRQQAILNIGEEPVWQDEYSHCNFWISNDIVPRYARRD